MPTLVHIPYSPWSQRARWALALQGVPHERVVYAIKLDEPWLRWRLRRPFGPLTLPVLLREDEPPLLDSVDIAIWAAARTERPPLITPANEAEVRAWVERADLLMAAGRVLTTRRVLDDPTALDEHLPPALRMTGPLGRAIARRAAHDLLDKYGHLAPEDPRAGMREVLEAARVALRSGPHLLGERSFADVALTMAMAFVEPVQEPRVRLGPHSRGCWRDEELAEEYGDLLAWRDGQWGVYEAEVGRG
jgi:glutathione S-transferase